MLKEKILDDIKQAMKSKDNFKRDTLRFLHSAIKQIEIDNRKDVSDEDIIKIIQKSMKQRNDTIAQYKDVNRPELIEKEENEIKILKEYLPEQIGDDELKSVIESIIKEVNATSIKDMGKIMGKASAKLSGRADGKRINEMATSILQ